MPNPRRKWTLQEDEIIRSSGLSLWKLERTLHANTETIRFRAQELGIELMRRAPKKNPYRPRRIRVPKNDPLLERLRMFHGA
jgi:hypothetical protein